MAKLSTNAIGILVIALSNILQYFDVIVPETEIQDAIISAVEIAGFLLLVRNQIKRPDVAAFIVRK